MQPPWIWGQKFAQKMPPNYRWARFWYDTKCDFNIILGSVHIKIENTLTNGQIGDEGVRFWIYAYIASYTSNRVDISMSDT